MYKMKSSGMQEELFTITEKDILPIVKRHLEKVTAAQWTSLLAGKMVFKLQVILAAMVTDIIQTVSAVLLRAVLPKRDPKGFIWRTVKVDLGKSFNKSFSTCLNAPQDSYGGIQELTELTEEEIEERVNSLVVTIKEKRHLPPKPAIFVSGLVSNIICLYDMIAQAASYLRGCLVTVNTKCPRQCTGIGKTKNLQSFDSERPFISEDSLTEDISNILMKWSKSETSSSTQESANSLPISPSPSANRAADEIVDIIMENAETPESAGPAGSSGSSVPHGPLFNMDLIIDEVRRFFASNPGPMDTPKEIEPEEQSFFSSFVRTHFDNMRMDLKQSFERQDEQFVLKLVSYGPETSPAITKKRLVTMTKQGTSEINFDTLETNLNNLMTEIRFSEEGLYWKLEDIMHSEEVSTFSKDLTDEMYTHLMTDQVYQLPFVPKGLFLSDSVISETKKTMEGTQKDFSPEVLYSITEDAVGKFLQPFFLWMMTEPVQSAKVAGALTDIENLLKKGAQPPEDSQTGPESLTIPASPSDSSHVSQAPDDGAQHKTILKHHDDNLKTTKTAKKKVTFNPIDEEFSADSTESTKEFLTNNLVVALFLRLLSKAEIKDKDLIPLIKEKITFLVMTKVKRNYILMNEENLQDITKVVFKDLCRTFGSAESVEFEFSEWDELCDKLKEQWYPKHLRDLMCKNALATDCNKHRAKTDKRKQRSVFRDVLRAVEEGDFQSETIRFGTERMTIDSWVRKRTYDAFREFVGSGMNYHLQANEFIRDVFELGPPMLVDSATMKAMKISRFERHLHNSAAFKARTKARSKFRDKRVDVGEF